MHVVYLLSKFNALRFQISANDFANLYIQFHNLIHILLHKQNKPKGKGDLGSPGDINLKEKDRIG